MSRMNPLAAILLIALAALVGCADRDAQRQAVADSAASSFEAASAIEQGADPAKPCAAIKSSSAAIIHAQGRAYPAADAYLPKDQP